MKATASPKEQVEPDSEEMPNLTLAEKTSEAFFNTDLSKRLLEPDLMVSTIHSIIGSNESLDARIPHKPSDELARLLVNLRYDEKSHLSPQAKQSLDEAIEACFLHSPVFKFALEIYLLDWQGKLVGASSSYELIESALNTAKAGKAKQVVLQK